MIKTIIAESLEGKLLTSSLVSIKEDFEIADMVLLPNGHKGKIVGSYDFNRGRIVDDNGQLRRYMVTQLKPL
jgi:hypothetical protein